MELGRYLVEAHLLEKRPVGELAEVHGVHRSWIYKLLARYEAEGEAGLEPRSRRPKSSPTKIRDLYEDEIVAIRKELSDQGFDAGAQTISFHLAQRHDTVPSVPTIWRVLRERGVRHPRAAQAPPLVVAPLRSRSAQRMLAERHHARALGRRHRGGDTQLLRRPLPLVCGQCGQGNLHLARCHGRLSRCRSWVGVPRIGAQRHSSWVSLKDPRVVRPAIQGFWVTGAYPSSLLSDRSV
jgi:transposase